MERKRKAIPNRTIGLQKAVIEDSFTEEACKACNGTGTYNLYIPSTTIRNLRGALGHVTISNDCSCEGGKVRHKIRVIRKGNIRAIV